MLEVILQFLRKRSAQAAHLLLAQLIDRVTILSCDMEAVDYDCGSGQGVLHGADVALPHIGADGLDALAMVVRDGLDPVHHGGLQPIRQDGQHVQATGGTPGGEHGYKVAMALFEGDLVDAEHCEWFKRGPVDRGGDPAVKDAEQGIVADIFFGDHISYGAVDQLHDEMPLVGLGMQGVRIIPVEFLGRCGMIIAVGTAKAFGPDAQIDNPPQDWQMAQQTRPIFAMLLSKKMTTAATGGGVQGALDREDELVGLREISLKHAYIGNIERN